MDEKQVRISKFISMILRHKPQKIGIELDEHGWADVDKLIKGLNKAGFDIDRRYLEQIVREDLKQRYAFSEDGSMIRANQGHSIPVDVELKQQDPPDMLWHGTGEKSVSSIMKQGLLPQGRLYVHLSSDISTAMKVGKRHGRPIIFEIDCKGMAEDGYVFYLSLNGVWLTKKVPARYLSLI